MYQEMIKHAVHPEGKLPERVAPNGIRSVSAQEMTDAMRAVLEEYGLPDVIAGLRETTAGTSTQAQGAVDTAENILRKRGHLWEVAFDGSERVPLKDLKGVRMIAYLVAHPGEPVEALTLMQLASGASPDDARIPRRAQLGATSGMSADPFGSSRDERLTRQDAADLRRRKAREEKEKPRAERLNDQEKAARLAESIANIDKVLKRDLALFGKPRTIDTDRDRARSAVAKNLARALKHIGDANPHLAMHLQNSLHVGETCYYAPSPPVEWATD
jgi:flagellar biosynthesis GTPase FlhF